MEVNYAGPLNGVIQPIQIEDSESNLLNSSSESCTAFLTEIGLNK